MARVVRRPAPSADVAISIRVSGARISVERGFDRELLREIVSALSPVGESR